MSKDSPRTSVLRDNDLIQKGQDDLIRRGDALALIDRKVGKDHPALSVELRHAIDALPAVQPTVKPLVWGEFKADGVFAERIWASEIYTIEKRNHAEVFDLYCSLWDGDNSVRFDALEAAKAAAQAAYEARILSVLDMQPTVSPELLATTNDVAALVEALDRTTSQGQRSEYSRVGHHLNEASWHVHLAGFRSRDEAEAFLTAALARVKG